MHIVRYVLDVEGENVYRSICIPTSFCFELHLQQRIYSLKHTRIRVWDHCQYSLDGGRKIDILIWNLQSAKEPNWNRSKIFCLWSKKNSSDSYYSIWSSTMNSLDLHIPVKLYFFLRFFSFSSPCSSEFNSILPRELQ